jgi:hypothetical protein
MMGKYTSRRVIGGLLSEVFWNLNGTAAYKVPKTDGTRATAACLRTRKSPVHEAPGFPSSAVPDRDR